MTRPKSTYGDEPQKCRSQPLKVPSKATDHCFVACAIWEWGGNPDHGDH
jgi:hypothetical protein